MPKIISVGGGKGGIGKSFFSTNLGGLLSMVGKNTLIVDLDTGGPNVHTVFGINSPDRGIQDFFDQKRNLSECIIESKLPRLSILSGKNCRDDLSNVAYSSKVVLKRSLKSLKYDFIILDLGAGTSRSLIEFFLMADYPVALFTPDPLSLENAFRFVHKAYTHKILETVPAKKLNRCCTELFEKKTSLRPCEILCRLEHTDKDYHEKVKKSLDAFFVYLVVNKVNKNISTGKNIESFYKKFFGENITLLSALPLNQNVEKALYKRELFVAECKKDKMTKKLMNIVKSFL